MPAHIESLWVPCDARMNRRDVKLAALIQHIPTSSAHPVLLGEPERGLKANPNPYHFPSFRHASSRNPFFLLCLDTGLRRHDRRIMRELVLNVTGATEQVLTLFLILHPLLCCRALEA